MVLELIWAEYVFPFPSLDMYREFWGMRVPHCHEGLLLVLEMEQRELLINREEQELTDLTLGDGGGDGQ